MANDSQKKKARKLETTSQLYNRINLGIHVLYMLVRVGYNWSSFGGGLWFIWIIFGVLDLFCSSSIYASIAGGYPYSHYQDVLFVSWFTQFCSLFSDWSFLIFLVIPAYVVFKLGSMFVTWCMTPDEEDVPMDAKEIKRMAKKERQTKRAQKFQR